MVTVAFREWLRGVARIVLQSPWETRKMAGKCISEVIVSRPVLAEWLLDYLQEVLEKVSKGWSLWVWLPWRRYPG